MDVWVVVSSTENGSRNEGVFSTPEIAKDTFVKTLQRMRFSDCSFPEDESPDGHFYWEDEKIVSINRETIDDIGPKFHY